MIYTLQDFTNITFNGFDIVLPEETISIINEIASKVGSPSYIKTPTFQKQEIKKPKIIGNNISRNRNSSTRKGDFGSVTANKEENNDDWERLRTFQATKIEEKKGIDVKIDLIRSNLNKMTNKNYNEQVNKIIEILDPIFEGEKKSNTDDFSSFIFVTNVKEGEPEILDPQHNKIETNPDIIKIGNIIFDIASNNRFYSQVYADLYSLLCKKYEIMQFVFEKNIDSFLSLFETIEYINPEENYDKYCSINKVNEKRKALSFFFVNLTINKILPINRLSLLLTNLMNQVLCLIKEENKTNEVDEFIENIIILYNKDIFDLENNQVFIDGKPFIEVINHLANIKNVNSYVSLSKKSVFKFMTFLGK
jgi:hypothetical protein